MDRRQFMASGSAAAVALAAEPVLARGAAVQGDAALNATLDAVFQDGIAHSPEYATSLGLDKGKLAPLRSQLSPATAAERASDLARNQKWARALTAINPATLTATGKRNRALAQYMLEQRSLAARDFGLDSVQRPYRLFQQGGAYFEIPDFLNSQHTINSAADAEAYLSRLSAFARVLDGASDIQAAADKPSGARFTSRVRRKRKLAGLSRVENAAFFRTTQNSHFARRLVFQLDFVLIGGRRFNRHWRFDFAFAKVHRRHRL